MIVWILQPKNINTPRKQQISSTKFPPYYYGKNPQDARDWNLDWFSHYRYWIKEMTQDLEQINTTVFNMWSEPHMNWRGEK